MGCFLSVVPLWCVEHVVCVVWWQNPCCAVAWCPCILAVHTDYVFRAHSLQDNGTHALIVLSSALRCVSDAMQHHAVTALGCCMQCEVALRQGCSACRIMAADV